MSQQTSSPVPIFLSPPHMSGREQQYVQEAFDTNWLAPLGPNVNAFEQEFCDYVGCKHALALGSGTFAIHLALDTAGVTTDDDVLVSTLTFSASINPIVYQNANPVFIDSEPNSWNLDPQLLEDALKERAAKGKVPKALVLVHLYGQCADIDPIKELCDKYGVILIEDAAESLGSTYKGAHSGTFGQSGIFSFNGNKIITTTGGGMLVSDDESIIAHARKLSTQAREPNLYEHKHTEIGYNYRLSNVLAGIGRGQLQVIDDYVAARRRNFDFYKERLGKLPGVGFMPDAGWGTHTRWFSCITIDPAQFGSDRTHVLETLQAEKIESRPIWMPMHMQPVFQQYDSYGGDVSAHLFDRSLCLPSGSSLTVDDLDRICSIIEKLPVASLA